MAESAATRLLTNPGSNLSPGQIERYGIAILPQRIVVDDVAHDTREPIGFAAVDGWVQKAKRWPSTIGTTAAETVAAYQAAAKEGARDILVVTTSRKVINSFDAATLARETFLGSSQGRGARIEVIDTGATDLAANLICSLAGEAIRAGLPWEDVVALIRSAVRDLRFVFSVATLENLVKGGRASFLRSLLADVLGVRPLIAFGPDGALRTVGTYKRRTGSHDAIVGWLNGQLAPKRRVWVGAFHTGDPAPAEALLVKIGASYDVTAKLVRPLAPGVYLHAGPGTVGAAICPIDELGWTPPTPRW